MKTTSMMAIEAVATQFLFDLHAELSVLRVTLFSNQLPEFCQIGMRV